MTLDEIYREEQKLIDVGRDGMYLAVLRLVRNEEDTDERYWHASAEQRTRALKIVGDGTKDIHLVLHAAA